MRTEGVLEERGFSFGHVEFERQADVSNRQLDPRVQSPAESGDK